MPKKKIEYAPFLFPWFSEEISKSRILQCMLGAAVALNDEDKLKYLGKHLTDFEAAVRSYVIDIIGAVLVSVGTDGLNFGGIGKIILSLIGSPILGIVSGCLVMTLLFRLFGRFSPSAINHRFKKMQVLSAAMMAFSHGSNDAQKSMGIITLALLSGGYIDVFEVPTYVKVLAATAMACGTAVGGWRIIKTIGGKIFKLEPISGFAADLNSSTVIFTATLLHLPVSTTHVVSGSIMGVGTAKRVNAVRWGVAQQMVMAWVLTIPCTAMMGAVAYLGVCAIFK